MESITLEQALYHRSGDAPQLVGRSPGFADAWLPLAERLVVGFGERRPGLCRPPPLFPQPPRERPVAVVQVLDRNAGLSFHLLVLPRAAYFGDPFALADRFAPPWEQTGSLPALTLPAEAPPPRTVADIRAVLKRVKAHALREGQD